MASCASVPRLLFDISFANADELREILRDILVSPDLSRGLLATITRAARRLKLSPAEPRSAWQLGATTFWLEPVYDLLTIPDLLTMEDVCRPWRHYGRTVGWPRWATAAA